MCIGEWCVVKLVPAAHVSVLLAACVSLQSRLSSGADNLSEKKIIIKRRAGKKYDGGVKVVRGVMLIILNS